MKSRHSFIVFSLLAIAPLGGPIRAAADAKAAPAVDANAPVQPALAGSYGGTWKSSTDANGELRISLKQDEARAWTAEASFTFEGTKVPMKPKTIEVEKTKVRIVFDWVTDSDASQSKLVGELKDNVLQGTYETSGAAGVSHGTWSVTRQ